VKKQIISAGIVAALVVYFSMTLVVFPQEFASKTPIEPQPTHSISLTDEQIKLGQSFHIEIQIENQNDVSDILITSVAFPRLEQIKDNVEIISYDYTQSPRYIKPEDKLMSEYTLGGVVLAQYPSIEAYSRNVPPDTSYQMELKVTPNDPGSFEVYIKTIAIPHTTDLSHYPYDGLLDSQGEYVSVYTVQVNP